jgi:hypothetical protein
MRLNSLLPAGNADAALDPKRFQAWLDTLPHDRPGVAARAFGNELLRLRGASNIRVRLKLFELAVDPAERLLRAIEKELAHGVLPLAAELQQSFIAVNALFKSLAASYAGIADEIAHKWIGIGFAKTQRLAVVRAMQFQAQRLDLAYRVYARGSNSAWTSLHHLYRLARDGGFATSAPQGAATTAEQIYVNALLLAFAEPTKLAPGELERVRFYVERHAKYAQLEEAPKTPADDAPMEACFLIRPKEARAGRSLVRAARIAVEPGDLVLRCNRLLTKLQGQLAGIEKGVEPARLGLPLAARQPQFAALLRNMHRLWSAPPVRRFSRQKFKPRVDLVVGFELLWGFLAGPSNRRRTDELPLKIEASEWAIGNESPGGFSLQYLAGNAGPVRVGEVVGLRPRDQSDVHICLTRRVVTGDLQSLELGLQKLAPAGVPTAISLEGPAARNGRQAHSVRVIILPRLPAADGGPALIAPPQTVSAGVKVSLPQRNGPVWLRVSRLIEQCASCDIFALAPLGPADQAQSAPGKTTGAAGAARSQKAALAG